MGSSAHSILHNPHLHSPSDKKVILDKEFMLPKKVFLDRWKPSDTGPFTSFLLAFTG